jgi:hypothetical protein
MKKVSDIMKELGFRQQGSVEVKKAFIKNLIQQANPGLNPTDQAKRKAIHSPEQLDLFYSNKKSS